MPQRKRTHKPRKPRTLEPRTFKPLNEIMFKGVPAVVLEVKNNNATIQFDDGSTLTVSANELRPNRSSGGRPEKPDKELFGQITCILRKDTIQQLREGAGGKYFGEFLQAHLDRFPLPTLKQYLATTVKHKKLPVIMAYGLSRDAKRLAREKARRETLSPKERAWEDSIREGVTRVVQQAYANQS